MPKYGIIKTIFLVQKTKERFPSTTTAMIQPTSFQLIKTSSRTYTSISLMTYFFSKHQFQKLLGPSLSTVQNQMLLLISIWYFNMIVTLGQTLRWSLRTNCTLIFLKRCILLNKVSLGVFLHYDSCDLGIPEFPLCFVLLFYCE